MAISTHPKPGTIVRVDLSEGFRAPEMVKRRPCVVLSPALPGRDFLCSIVPLSTSEPHVKQPYHLLLTFEQPLPAPYHRQTMWLKGDIVSLSHFTASAFSFAGSTTESARTMSAFWIMPSWIGSGRASGRASACDLDDCDAQAHILSVVGNSDN